MLGTCVERITGFLLAHGVIEEDSADVYRFGIELLLLKTLHFGTMLFIGFLLGMLPETVVFMVSYSLIREYAGGFHANSRKACYAVSWVIIIVALGLCRLVPAAWVVPVSLVFTAVSLGFLFRFAPVGNPDKPLDEEETKHYRFRARLIAGLLSVGVVILCFFASHFAWVIAISLAIETVMMLLGKRVLETAQ